ncbi:nitrilase-related carbon-nitrogen hydrolase [Synechococcus sp. H70.1]|uniref:nitrilase-related carbon-nitrogen hydrolase n=1 Tax=Synechococcus sp. H70.1 TaxID=2964527 RepID=UPI0039C6CE5A
MQSYLAAAIQMTSTPDLASNLQQAEEWIDFAARRGCELVTLPENFAFMGPEAEKARLAPEIAQRAEEFLAKMAQRYQVFVLGGGYPCQKALSLIKN